MKYSQSLAQPTSEDGLRTYQDLGKVTLKSDKKITRSLYLTHSLP